MKIKKSITINATSTTEDGKTIATFYASISGDGAGTNTSMNVADQELYEVNKSIVREDKAAFDKFVYEVEDDNN
ncbi:hypothetical protein G7084_03830 [Weissella coleopterorum]|uniref:Uncharacterized protein n=1 Tax=Weissella coleopterorum TaxID=2714949 RepID=A0A6G8B1R6_9LACO|nr:hypothetical protein G7084_03830 [Weissella coleopterorum]